MGVWVDVPNNERWIRRRVLIGAALEDITRWIDGVITINASLRGVIPNCSFSLSHKRLSYAAAASWACRPQPLEVWVHGRSADAAEWVKLFSGLTEVGNNTGLFIPTGSIRAVGSALWADKPVCRIIPPMSGNTRADVLGLLAATLGGTVDASGIVSNEVKKAIDIQNVPLLRLAQELGPLERWVPRVDDGVLTLVSMDDFMAGATPVHAFVPGNYYIPSENIPERPITTVIRTGQAVFQPEDVTDFPVTVGDTEILVSTDSGALTDTVDETTETYAPLGVGTNPAVSQVVKRISTGYTWELNGDSLPTSRLATKDVTTERFYSNFAYTGSGGAYTTFTDGSFHHTDTDETLQETEKVSLECDWHADGYLSAERTTEKKFIAFQCPATQFPQYTWPDGTLRGDPYETYQEVSFVRTSDEIIAPYAQSTAIAPTVAAACGILLRPGRQRLRVSSAWRRAYVSGSLAWEHQGDISEAWIEAPDGSSYHKSTRVWTQVSILTDKDGVSKSGPLQYDSDRPEDGQGQMPEPRHDTGRTAGPSTTATEDESVPQFSLTPFMATQSAVVTEGESPLPEHVDAAFNADAESAIEAGNVAAWVLIDSLAPRHPISHPGIPTLKLATPITYTDPARSRDAAPGWVDEYTFSLSETALDAVTIVALDPFPEGI